MTVSAAPSIFYPESDGKPLADNTIQFHLIVTIQGGTDALFANDPNVFVAGDLFWYPVEGEPWIKQAPDVMVAFGRPKGDRRSYKQWEEDNIPPQVVFEIASPSNTRKELEETKLRFYQLYGVEEYYIFDPDKGVLKGWLRQGATLKPISEMLGWISPRLHVRFQVTDGNLELYGPDGEKFASYLEIVAQNKLEKERAERESQRAEQVEREKNALANKQRKSVTRLLAMGLTVEQVAEARLIIPGTSERHDFVALLSNSCGVALWAALVQLSTDNNKLLANPKYSNNNTQIKTLIVTEKRDSPCGVAF